MSAKELEKIDRDYALTMKSIRDGGRGTNRYEKDAFIMALRREMIQTSMPDMPIPIPCKAKQRVQQRFATKGAYVGRTGRRKGRHNKRLNYRW